MNRNNRFRKILRDNDFINWFRPSIRTMLYQITSGGQAVRISGLTFSPLADYLQTVLSAIVVKATIPSGKDGGVVLSKTEIYKLIPTVDTLGHRCKARKPDENCYYFPKSSIRRLVTQLIQHMSTKSVRIEQSALDAAHSYIEFVAQDILHHAILLMNHAHRNTLMGIDIDLAIRSRKDCY